jgi:NADH-quinone oxidoreductase subunit N
MYVLCSFNKRSVYSIESAIKYFIIGSFASLLILLGIIFLFGFTGFLNFSDLTLFFSYIDLFNGDILIIGLLSSFIFIAIGFLFKVYSAPFHF